MNEFINLLDKTIDSINVVTDKFYQQNISEGYLLLADSITIIMECIDAMEKFNDIGYDLGVDINDILQIIKETMNILEQRDAILLSDILQYELLEQFIKVKNTISK